MQKKFEITTSAGFWSLARHKGTIYAGAHNGTDCSIPGYTGHYCSYIYRYDMNAGTFVKEESGKVWAESTTRLITDPAGQGKLFANHEMWNPNEGSLYLLDDDTGNWNPTTNIITPGNRSMGLGGGYAGGEYWASAIPYINIGYCHDPNDPAHCNPECRFNSTIKSTADGYNFITRPSIAGNVSSIFEYNNNIFAIRNNWQCENASLFRFNASQSQWDDIFGIYGGDIIDGIQYKDKLYVSGQGIRRFWWDAQGLHYQDVKSKPSGFFSKLSKVTDYTGTEWLYACWTSGWDNWGDSELWRTKDGVNWGSVPYYTFSESACFGLATLTGTDIWAGTYDEKRTSKGIYYDPFPRPWDFDIARAIAISPKGTSNGGQSIYVLDGYGGVSAVGGASVINPSSYYFGWDIARDITILPYGKGYYVLDGYGGIHEGGTATYITATAYWQGWDIAKAIAAAPGGVGVYVLDGFGGVWAEGGAPVISPASHYFGWDIARDIDVISYVNNGSSGIGYYVLDGYGAVWSGGNPPPPTILQNVRIWNWDIARAIVAVPGGVGGYILDGYGGVNAIGGAPSITPASTYFGWDIARDIAFVTDSGYYVLDGYGGIHPGGTAGQDKAKAIAAVANGGTYILDGYGGVIAKRGAPVITPASTYFGWDIARDITFLPSGTGYYVLDGYGGIHKGGNAPNITATSYWPNWDIAKAIVAAPEGGVYVLDGYGGVSAEGGATGISPSSDYFGWDIARDITMYGCTSNGCTGYYVLDGYGGIHKGGNAPNITATSYWPGWDIAKAIVRPPYPECGSGVYVLDGYGGVWAEGGAYNITPASTYFGWDIARDISFIPDGSCISYYVLDGYGGIHPGGGGTVWLP